MQFSSKSNPNVCSQGNKSKKSRQQLIVHINIGKKGQASQIRLCEINNMNYIESQIKHFIKGHGLKQSAFSYIKQIIVKQIGRKRQEIYRESHSKCSKSCKCQHRMRNFREKQKKIMGVISIKNNTNKSESYSLENKDNKSLQHISIKITREKDKTINKKSEEHSSSIFNSSLTLPSSISQNQRFALTDYLQRYNGTSQFKKSTFPTQPQIRLSSVEQYKKKGCPLENSPSNCYAIKNSQKKSFKTYESSFSKNSLANDSNSICCQTKCNLQNSLAENDSSLSTCRRSKFISTKQRKEKIMTPQKFKFHQCNPSNFVNNSCSVIADSKNIFEQQKNKIIEKILQSPLFPENCIPQSFESVVEKLFKKLTLKNPPYMKELHSQYVSYQSLERQQLQFMGALFEKISHKELNNLKYGNFRSNALKYCWEQLSQLVELKQRERDKQRS